MFALAKNSDRGDDACRRLKRVREIGVFLPTLASGKARSSATARGWKSAMARTIRASVSRDATGPCGFAERLVVDRDNDHAVRGRTRAGQKKPPVEGQIFDPVQRGGGAHHLIEAEPGAKNKGGDDEAAGQQPEKGRRFRSALLPEAERRAPNLASPHFSASAKCRLLRCRRPALPSERHMVETNACDSNSAVDHKSRGSLRADFHRPFCPPNSRDGERRQDLKLWAPRSG